jgi:hypothetical protein
VTAVRVREIEARDDEVASMSLRLGEPEVREAVRACSVDCSPELVRHLGERDVRALIDRLVEAQTRRIGRLSSSALDMLDSLRTHQHPLTAEEISEDVGRLVKGVRESIGRLRVAGYVICVGVRAGRAAEGHRPPQLYALTSIGLEAARRHAEEQADQRARRRAERGGE